jgi:23S rRNA (pseudouridine1915-N3)-methyltransferase
VAKLHLVALGARLRGWALEARDDYLRRMPRGYAVSPSPRVPRGALVVALDERGRELTTAQLAARLSGWMAGAAPVAFVIGGADGLAPEIRSRAHFLLRLSTLTLPHALAQVVLAEQLYRAATLLSGHPYHRE